MKKSIVIAIIVAAVAIPAGVYAAGPLFISTSIDEAPPVPSSGQRMDKDEGKLEETAVVTSTLTGNFVGVGDGIHDAVGIAKVIPVDGGSVLRLEEFRSTNGPDLYVYLSSDKDAKEFVSLGRLKANIGSQNYEIPPGTDLSRYDTVLIWCQQFSVLFGSAELNSA